MLSVDEAVEVDVADVFDIVLGATLDLHTDRGGVYT